MLALLLALSPGAVAVQASAPTAPAPAQNSPSLVPTGSAVSAAPTDSDTVGTSTDGNTSAVMTLGSAPARTAFGTPSLSLGSSLAMDRDGVETELSVKRLDRQLNAAETVEKQKQILNRYRYQIENRIISLNAREEQATRAFSNGTISKGEYLRTLGRIDSEAAAIRRMVAEMRRQANAVPKFRMVTEANTLGAKLVTLEGPVRNRISKTTRGQTASYRVYVATKSNGVVLSTIVNGEYVREIVRKDKRNPAAEGDTTIRSAREGVAEQYPWAWNHRTGSETSSEFGTTNVFRIRIKYTHGELVAYYDGGTKSVFRETQYKRLTRDTPLPTGPSASNTSENLTVAVNRTYAGGPLRVRLTNATGGPVQGEVRLDGEAVGRTNADGVLWTLSPAEQFEVSASYDFRTVNVTATPVDS
jgi:hypothetical protein